jgi:hypothetical protein
MKGRTKHRSSVLSIHISGCHTFKGAVFRHHLLSISRSPLQHNCYITTSSPTPLSPGSFSRILILTHTPCLPVTQVHLPAPAVLTVLATLTGIPIPSSPLATINSLCSALAPQAVTEEALEPPIPMSEARPLCHKRVRSILPPRRGIRVLMSQVASTS